MTLQVLDASVAIKWFIKDEPGRLEAIRILDDVRDAPERFAVPELFLNEMLAVLVRLLAGKPGELHGYLGALQDLGLQRVGNGRELLERAVDLASRYDLSGYDAVYAATAQLTDGCWLTADARAHRKIQRLKISKVVCQV
ncbi:MAG: type II toxin-antitoxin system VapC family toxin [Deltaproteobacteria bacterium]|nr:type II toxin-antitoxin system VapC family toxin [Deltaproteobacteria bacterium]